MGILLIGGIAYYGTPAWSRVGYQPLQPIPFSHVVHVGQLGMDCRHCHTAVEEAAHANIPDLQTCLNCHGQNLGNVKSESPLLAPLREAVATGQPVEWARVHRVPDYAQFNHAVHVKRGVSCVSCHGRVDQMEVVTHNQPLTMSWCLECHRNPEPHLRPAEHVTNLAWRPEGGDAAAEQARLLEYLHREVHIQPAQDCTTCHR